MESSLSELSKRLEEKKRRELREVERIEKDALRSLAVSLRRFSESELNTIEDAIRRRRKEIQDNAKEMAESISRSVARTKKEVIAQSKTLREEMIEEIEELRRELRLSEPRRWLYRIVSPLLIIGAAALGTWGLSAYLSARITAQTQEIEKLKAEAKAQRKTMNRFVIQSWNNAIGVEKEPYVWKDRKTGLWIVQFEQSK